MSSPVVSERKILFLVAAVQFVNIVDFMMIMPLGPELAEAIGIPASAIGMIGASYTFSAFVTGLIGSLFLDRFDRRSALATCLAGLLVGTALGGLANNLWQLIGARIIAGAFGGPAIALGFAIVSDVIPPERRGRAMGAVMGAFSAAAVLGVPAGLQLAHWGGWRMPFFVLAGAGFCLGLATLRLLPRFRGHIVERKHSPFLEMAELLRRPKVQLASLVQFCMMAAGFLIIPNISSYVQYNAGYPRDRIGMLYLIGGLVSFFAMRLTGKIIDATGAVKVVAVVTLCILINLAEGFLFGAPQLPVLLMFLIFMVCQSVRNVSVQTVTTKVPEPRERARFQALQTAVQHLATAIGASTSTLFLTEVVSARGRYIEGMPTLTLVSMVLSICVPLVLFQLEKRLTTVY